jgi:acyl-CoA synthetase (AMP-forming)/AMP-acid ligase II
MQVHQVLSLSARRRPDATALVWNDEARSFAHVLARVRSLAGWLDSLVPQGSRVAVLSENCPEVIEALYAVPMADCILVQINYRLHPSEIDQILADCDAQVLLHHADFRHVAEALSSGAQRIEWGTGTTSSYERGLASATPAAPESGGDDGGVAWLLYTSGTTGKSKGVMLTHRNLLTSACNSIMGWPLTEHDLAVMSTPLCHISAYFVLMFHLQCCPIVLHARFDIERTLRDLAAYRATMLLTPPTAGLANNALSQSLDCSSLRMIMYGGGMTSADELKSLRGRFGEVMMQAYGMTESAGNVALLQGYEHPLLERDGMVPFPTGRSMPLCALRLVDEAGRDVAENEIGEIWVSGDQVAAGYWNAPEATAEVFGDGWLRTGDMARKGPGGYFRVVDRKKDLIKTGGQNVVSREVEAVLESHPAVAEAAVIGVPHPRWGEQVVAVAVLREGRDADETGLITWCSERMSRFKCPKRVVFQAELPKNALAKVLKRELRKIFESPRIDP